MAKKNPEWYEYLASENSNIETYGDIAIILDYDNPEDPVMVYHRYSEGLSAPFDEVHQWSEMDGYKLVGGEWKFLDELYYDVRDIPKIARLMKEVEWAEENEDIAVAVLDEMANEPAVESYSYPRDDEAQNLEQYLNRYADEPVEVTEVLTVATAGDAVAIDGELTSDSEGEIRKWLESEGWELSDYGGWAGNKEEELDYEHVTEAIFNDNRVGSRDIADYLLAAALNIDIIGPAIEGGEPDWPRYLTWTSDTIETEIWYKASPK